MKRSVFAVSEHHPDACILAIQLIAINCLGLSSTVNGWRSRPSAIIINGKLKYWGGGVSSTTTSVQHPLGWYDGCHSTTWSYRWREERVIVSIKCMRSPHTSYRWRGERVIETIKCMRSPHTSYRWRGERVIETIKCMLSPHTSYRWRGERVIETIKCMLSPHTSYRWRGERES